MPKGKPKFSMPRLDIKPQESRVTLISAQAELTELRRMQDQKPGWGGNLIWEVEKDSGKDLYQGCHADALDVEELRRRNVGGIINCAAECIDHADLQVVSVNEPRPEEGNITVLRLEENDRIGARIDRHFLAAAEFAQCIFESGKSLLVHCRMGISRASTITCAIMMLLRGMTFEDALCCIKRERSQADPNLGFLLSLDEFQAAAVREFQKYCQTRRAVGYTGPLSLLIRDYGALGLLRAAAKEASEAVGPRMAAGPCAAADLQDSPLVLHRAAKVFV